MTVFNGSTFEQQLRHLDGTYRKRLDSGDNWSVYKIHVNPATLTLSEEWVATVDTESLADVLIRGCAARRDHFGDMAALFHCVSELVDALAGCQMLTRDITTELSSSVFQLTFRFSDYDSAVRLYRAFNAVSTIRHELHPGVVSRDLIVVMRNLQVCLSRSGRRASDESSPDLLCYFSSREMRALMTVSVVALCSMVTG